MVSKIEKFSLIIKLVYKIREEKNISIFSSYFVETNKNKCLMIINNKLYSLTDKYQIIDENTKTLKIKLLLLNNKKVNLSYMFYNCNSLKEFNLIKKFDEIDKDKDIQDWILNNLYYLVNNEQNNYIFNAIINQAIKISNRYNNSKKDNENENTNNILNLNHDIFSHSNNLSFKEVYNISDINTKSEQDIKKMSMYNYFYEKYNSKKIDSIIAYTRDLEILTCSSIDSENNDCDEYSFSEEESFSFE